MTNKEAKRILQFCIPMKTEKQREAINLAIKALERDGSLSYNELTTSVFSCPVCGAMWRDKETEE